MRFCYYDRVTEIRKGERIAGVKTFALSEEFCKAHFGKVALVPGAILVESMAQLLGWLVNYSHDFRLVSIMSLIEAVEISPDLRPGFEARVYGEIVSSSHKDSIGRARMEAGGRIIASVDRIIYSHFYDVDPGELSRWFTYYSGLNSAGTGGAVGWVK
jgi:3-hydroxyacyl-[acyl-carrier-protein] dehydratase